eukprot:9496064-Pyramimonas_sp.AAC.1
MANQSIVPSSTSSRATTASSGPGDKRRMLDVPIHAASDLAKGFMGTWPRPVFGKVMQGLYNQLLDRYSEVLGNATSHIHETGQTFMIQFPTVDQAKRFRLMYSQGGSKWLNRRG